MIGTSGMKELKLHVSQARTLTQFLLLTVSIHFLGIVSVLNSIFPLQGSPQCLKSSL